LRDGLEGEDEEGEPVDLVDVLCRRIFMLPLAAGDVVRLELQSNAPRRTRPRVRLLGLEEGAPEIEPMAIEDRVGRYSVGRSAAR
jgi:hypothetical protein